MVAVLEGLNFPKNGPFQYDFLHAKNRFTLSGLHPDTRQRLTATQ
ncbi:hypothetical protein GKAS_04639 [Kluyvera ascorbata ATCC 33433]|jgi:hypothetical protein|nr:hypothetical protein GKAS_04639 [Kluyvera ascorbata ATCC 33433]